MFENPRRGRQARNFTTNVPKILDLKSSSEQIFFRKLSLGAPANCAYSIPFNSSNVGKFIWSLILRDCIKVQEKKKKIVVLCSLPRQNVKLRHFHVVNWNVHYKYFANLNLLVFCRSRCPRLRRWLGSEANDLSSFLNLSIGNQPPSKIFFSFRFYAILFWL